MAKDAVKRALARCPELRPIQEVLLAPPPRPKVNAHSPYWEPAVNEGVAVQGWVFNVSANKSDPHEHSFFYEVAYVQDGITRVFSHEMSIDPWDWKYAGSHGTWFHETVLECQAATVLLHPERPPVLFGDTQPYKVVTIDEQIARARAAPAEQLAREIEVAIELLQEASSKDRRGVAMRLAPHASVYTERFHDDFYVVADLYAYARKGGDVLGILERVAPHLPDAKAEQWAAE